MKNKLSQWVVNRFQRRMVQLKDKFQNHKNILEKEKMLWQEYGNTLPPKREGEYISCTWLEGGISFMDGSVMLCCAHPTIIESHTHNPNLKKILSTRKQTIDDLNNDPSKAGPCQNCSYLVKKKWPPKAYLFDFVTIAHYRECNLKCNFCYVMKDKSLLEKAKVSEKIKMAPFFKKLLNEKILSPHAIVNISGGEPALFKEFDSLVDLLYQKIQELKIFSNGTIFSKSLFDALSYPTVSLVLSLDAADPVAYQKIKGKDLCQAAWENAKKYASVGNDRVIAKMIIMEENINDIANFVEKAKFFGIKNLYYDLVKSESDEPNLANAPEAIAEFKFQCLKNNIFCSNAQAGCTQKIENEAAEIFNDKVKKAGLEVPSCSLVINEKNISAKDSVKLCVMTQGYPPDSLHFKFLVKYENMDWQIFKDYSNSNECLWVPKRKGNYSCCAYIREKCSSQVFQNYSSVDLVVD